MKTPTVHILATCRKKELLPSTLLVFDSIRTGFPNAKIFVTYNGHFGRCEIFDACRKVGAAVSIGPGNAPHYGWIEQTVAENYEPIVFCDTDMIFYDSIEHWKFGSGLAGRLVPEFYDKYVRRITHERLHTSLLFVDPEKVRHGISEVESVSPEFPCRAKSQFYESLCYSFRQKHYFHDCTSLLYHAIGGRAFSELEKNAYTHLQCGTFLDLAGPRHRGLTKSHEQGRVDPQSVHGLWKLQEKYQKAYAPGFVANK